MADQSAKVVPGIPLNALDAIADDNVRQVLQALVQAHHVRNGDAGSGDNRFITAKEAGLTKGRSTIGSNFGGGSDTGNGTVLKPGDVARIINDLQAQIITSPLYQALGNRIALIDAPTGTVARIKNDLLTAADRLIASVDTQVGQTPVGVTNLADVLDGSIRQITAIKTQAGLSAAAIVQLNTISADSESTAARALYTVYTAFYDPASGLMASRAEYTRLINTESDARKALATLHDALNAQVNDKSTGLAASRIDYVNLIGLEATARTAVATSLTGLIAQVINPATNLPYAEGMIAEDRSIKLAADTANVTQTNAIYAALGATNRTYYQSTDPYVAPVQGSAYKPATPSIPARPAIPATATNPAIPAVAAVPASPAVPAVVPVTGTQPGDIWYDTAHDNRPKRWSGTAWVDTSDARVAAVTGGLTNEISVRLNADNALVSAINTMWAAVGGASGLTQAGGTITVNMTGAVAQTWQQTQAALRDGAGALISSAAIKVTAEAAATKADVYAQWTIHMDVGNVATGFRQAGFGISNFNGQVDFGVRADTFFVAAPSDSGVPNSIPFIVKTAPWTDTQGQVRPAGAYLSAAFITEINADRINTSGLKIRDSSGKIIFQSGEDLASSVNSASDAATAATRAASDAALSASTAIGKLNLIASDAWLTAGEKPAVRTEIQAITAEWNGIATLAGQYGVSNTNYSSATLDVEQYCYPLLYDMTADTPIDGTLFSSKFTAYYTARQALLNAISTEAGKYATWAGVVSKSGGKAGATTIISDASIGTLLLAGHAVTVPMVVNEPGVTNGAGTTNWLTVASGTITLDYDGFVFAATTAYIGYGSGWVEANSRLLINGSIVSVGGGLEAWVNAVHSGGAACFAGPCVVQLQFAAVDARAQIYNPSIVIQTAYK